VSLATLMQIGAIDPGKMGGTSCRCAAEMAPEL
jgi:hypothetical protein